MFKSLTIVDIFDGDFNEECMVVEESFFFTTKIESFYNIYNKNNELIGLVPSDYNLFFRIDNSPSFEDIDMFNIIRFYEQGISFELVGTKEGSNKVDIIDSSTIGRFELIEDQIIHIPFTNKAFDSEGIIVFKNMKSLADDMDIEDMGY